MNSQMPPQKLTVNCLRHKFLSLVAHNQKSIRVKLIRSCGWRVSSTWVFVCGCRQVAPGNIWGHTRSTMSPFLPLELCPIQYTRMAKFDVSVSRQRCYFSRKSGDLQQIPPNNHFSMEGWKAAKTDAYRALNTLPRTTVAQLTRRLLRQRR